MSAQIIKLPGYVFIRNVDLTFAKNAKLVKVGAAFAVLIETGFPSGAFPGQTENEAIQNAEESFKAFQMFKIYTGMED